LALTVLVLVAPACGEGGDGPSAPAASCRGKCDDPSQPAADAPDGGTATPSTLTGTATGTCQQVDNIQGASVTSDGRCVGGWDSLTIATSYAFSLTYAAPADLSSLTVSDLQIAPAPYSTSFDQPVSLQSSFAGPYTASVLLDDSFVARPAQAIDGGSTSVTVDPRHRRNGQVVLSFQETLRGARTLADYSDPCNAVVVTVSCSAEILPSHVGTACQADADCGSFLACDAGTCVGKASGLDDLCITGAYCPAGFVCQGASRWSTSGRCEPPPPPPPPPPPSCDFGRACPPELVCDPHTSKCVDRLGYGESCEYPHLDWCRVGLRCEYYGRDITQTCR
jgi:hypothetical protein